MLHYLRFAITNDDNDFQTVVKMIFSQTEQKLQTTVLKSSQAHDMCADLHRNLLRLWSVYVRPGN